LRIKTKNLRAFRFDQEFDGLLKVDQDSSFGSP